MNPFIRFAFSMMLICAYQFCSAQETIYAWNPQKDKFEKQPIATFEYQTERNISLHLEGNAKRPGEKLRNVGIGLTLPGVALLITGIALMSTADALYYNSTNSSTTGTTESGDLKGGLGVVAATAGLGLTIPGIICWTKGARRMKGTEKPSKKATSNDIE